MVSSVDRICRPCDSAKDSRLQRGRLPRDARPAGCPRKLAGSNGEQSMNGEQQSHDAQKTLADLRDHLARHDKPIAFFFGAGTSCSVRVPVGDAGATEPLIPAVPGLTAACKKDGADLGNEYVKAWAS